MGDSINNSASNGAVELIGFRFVHCGWEGSGKFFLGFGCCLSRLWIGRTGGGRGVGKGISKKLMRE